VKVSSREGEKLENDAPPKESSFPFSGMVAKGRPSSPKGKERGEKKGGGPPVQHLERTGSGRSP